MAPYIVAPGRFQGDPSPWSRSPPFLGFSGWRILVVIICLSGSFNASGYVPGFERVNIILIILGLDGFVAILFTLVERFFICVNNYTCYARCALRASSRDMFTFPAFETCYRSVLSFGRVFLTCRGLSLGNILLDGSA